MAKRKFINPLTQATQPVRSDENVPITPVVQPQQPVEETKKQKKEAFEATHQRFTSWMDKGLKRKFDELAAKKNVSKSALLNEAIEALLHKQERKPYTRKEQE